MDRATPSDGHGWIQRLRRHTVGIVAFELLIVGGWAVGGTAEGTSVWVVAATFLAASVCIAIAYAHHAQPTTRDLHIRAAVHVIALAVVLHTAGWAAVLVPVQLLAASDLHRASGLPVGRIVLGWVAAVTVVGQAAVVAFALPTVVGPRVALVAATAGLFVTVVVVRRIEDDTRELADATADAQRRAARLRGVLAGGDGCVLVVEGGELVLAGPGIARLLGLVDDRHLVDQLRHRVHVDDLSVLDSVLMPSHPTGEEALRLRRGDDSWVEVCVTWSEEGGPGETVLHLRDVTREAELRDEAQRVALIDPLTGLANRRLLDMRLPQLCATASRHGEHSVLLFVDLDGFKQVNDTLGHAVGDALLRAIAGDLTDGVRAADTVARFGGDEFVLLLHAPERAHVGMITRRVTEAISRPRIIDGTSVRVGASVGVREILPGDTPGTVLVQADAAMYLAKRAGGGQVVHHDDVGDRRASVAVPEQLGQR